MKIFSSMLTGLLTVVVILFLAGFLEVVIYRTANTTNGVRAVEGNLEKGERPAFSKGAQLLFLEDHYTLQLTRPYWLG